MYSFTFRRTRNSSMSQTVHVHAASTREAFALFESLYPFQHFTPYRLKSVVS